jgi:anaerobic magnesium-protoporphyrin IX monomethyl ester cyclase
MANVLLINPSFVPTYGGTKISVTSPYFPALGLAAVAAVARVRGHHVKILDLSYRAYDFQLIRKTIEDMQADVVGVTGTTPLMNQIRDISVLVQDIAKETRRKIFAVAGGPHVTALPEQSLRESMLDAVFVGEADYSFADFCDVLNPAHISGLYYRDGDNIISTGWRPLVENLDELPMPAWDLYNPEDYKGIVAHLLARRTPITVAEFSRGCVFQCDFCASKITLGQGYRKKSPARCAAEVKRIEEVGFREFWLADDIFTSDQKWATDVCHAITAAKADVTWTCTNGIRVESADANVFEALRQAGCYRVSFGFESGNDAILKAFGKGGKASIEQGRHAVRIARRAGLDTAGTFLLGLAEDTEDTMNDTIEYARALPLDMLKFGVTIAFPGTIMFDRYVKKGLVRSYDWDQYFAFTDEALFNHEHLSYDTIKRYMTKAYQRAMLFNPEFAFRRLLRGFRTGEFFYDAWYAIRMYFLPASSAGVQSAYYAKERWPHYDFWSHPPEYVGVLKPLKQRSPEMEASLSTAVAIPFRAVPDINTPVVRTAKARS